MEKDIQIKFPNGQIIELQYRNYEIPCLDVIMPENVNVCVWKYDDMEAAPKANFKGSGQHQRTGKQIVLDINPIWLEKPS